MAYLYTADVKSAITLINGLDKSSPYNKTPGFMRKGIIFSLGLFYLLSHLSFTYENLMNKNQIALYNKIEELKKVRFYKIERGRVEPNPLHLYEFTMAQKLIVTQDWIIDQLNLALLNAKKRGQNIDFNLHKKFNEELINAYDISNKINEAKDFVELDRMINSSLIKLSFIPLKFQLLTKVANDMNKICDEEVNFTEYLSEYINYEFDITSIDALQTQLTNYIEKLATKEYELLKLVKDKKVGEEKRIIPEEALTYTIRTNKGLIIIYAQKEKIEKIKSIIEGLSEPYLQHEKLLLKLLELKETTEEIYKIEEFYLREEEVKKYDTKVVTIREAEILNYIPLIEGLSMTEAEELLNFFSFKVINSKITPDNEEKLHSIVKEALKNNKKVIVIDNTHPQNTIMIGVRNEEWQLHKIATGEKSKKLINPAENKHYLPTPKEELKIKRTKQDGKDVLIPVEIRDSILKRGAEIILYTHDNKMKRIKLPPRRVIIPAKFYHVVRGLGEKGKYGGKDGSLIIQIHPKIREDFKVDIKDTADYGIVANVEYQDIVKTKIEDVLNKTGKQDVATQVFIKTGKKDIWCINTENLLERHNPRIIDVERKQSIMKNLDIRARIDTIKGKEKINFGTNLIYKRRNKEFTFGNITKKVDTEQHFQVKFDEKYVDFIVRLEDFSFKKINNYHSLLIGKLGAQLCFKTLPYGLTLKIGNLKVPRVEGDIEEGKVKDELNFLLTQEFQFGRQYLLPGRFSWFLDTGCKIIGFGEDIWLQGRLRLNLNFGLYHQLQFEINDDFIRLAGKQVHSPWQNRRLTFIQYRKFVDDKTILGKLNLHYAFFEILSKREDYSIPFHKRARYRIGAGYELPLFRYRIPIEAYIERDYEDNIYYRLLVSLREWM